MSPNNSINLIKKLTAYIPGIVYQYRLFPDGHSTFPYASQGMIDIFGCTPEDAKKDAIYAFNVIHPDDLETVHKTIDESARNFSPWNIEFRVNHPIKGELWVKGYSNPERLLDGSVLWHGVVVDITDKKRFESRLEQNNHLLSLYGGINEMIVYSDNEEEIFQKACEVVINLGNFALAWVGIADKSSRSIIPISYAGQSKSYLDCLPKISIEDNLLGRGPTGRAFRENKTFVNNDLLSSLSFVPWKKKAEELGFRSSISLPLVIKDEVIGTFNIYSKIKNFFDESEISLLEKISKNISFAVETIRIRHETAVSEKNFGPYLTMLLWGSFLQIVKQKQFLRPIKNIRKFWVDLMRILLGKSGVILLIKMTY